MIAHFNKSIQSDEMTEIAINSKCELGTLDKPNPRNKTTLS